MKKLITILTATLLIFSCTDKGNKNKATPPTARVSSKHIAIPATKISIIPPADFTLSKRIVGLEGPEGKYFLKFTIYSSNFKDNTKLLDVDYLKKERKDVMVDGYQGIFSSFNPGQDMKTMYLLLGDSTFSVLVHAYAPTTDEKMMKDMESSMFSVVYEKDKVEPDIYYFAPFTIDITHSVFRHVKRVPYGFSYSTSKEGLPVVETGGSTLSINLYNPEVYGSISNKAIVKNMIDMLKADGIKDIILLEESEASIAGQDAYEMVVSGTVGSQENFLFYLASFKTDSIIYTFSGVSLNSNKVQTIKEFKYLLSTMQLK